MTGKRIPNSKNLLPEVQNKDYDPGNRYSCPYFWGTVGILYNKNVVSQEDLDKEGWNILCDENIREIFICMIPKGIPL